MPPHANGRDLKGTPTRGTWAHCGVCRKQQSQFCPIRGGGAGSLCRPIAVGLVRHVLYYKYIASFPALAGPAASAAPRKKVRQAPHCEFTLPADYAETRSRNRFGRRPGSCMRRTPHLANSLRAVCKQTGFILFPIWRLRRVGLRSHPPSKWKSWVRIPYTSRSRRALKAAGFAVRQQATPRTYYTNMRAQIQLSSH